MKTIKRIFVLILLTILPAVAVVAVEIGAEIVYFENPAGDMNLIQLDGSSMTPDFGVVLPVGTRIDTGSGILELRLVPNGTILKLDSGTDFQIKSIQDEEGAEETVFSLIRGKLRTLAARHGRGEKYTVETPSAICAVRGTEFINEVGENGSAVIVRYGSVYVESIAGDRWITLGANQGLNTRSANYRPIIIPIKEIESMFAGFAFLGTDPTLVPGAPSAGAGEPTGSASGDIGRPVTEAVAREREYEPKSYDERGAFGRWIADSLGGEIGTTTIEGDTYSKLILSPVFETGSLRTALYLPIIYVDLYDGSTWYQPRGNNEWSFGIDQSGWQDIMTDVWTDLWLKIRYIEYGDAEWDPFYFKVGNLNTMSLGHGALVYQFANDFDFPAVRRVGFNMGYEKTLGIEVVADDLTRPNLVGLRLSASPFQSYQAFEFGISGVADLRPAAEAPDPGYYGDPWFLAGSLDVDLFEINSGFFKAVVFADGSAMAPVYRSDADSVDFPNVSAGPAWDMLWKDGRPTNFGLRGGLRGVLGPIRYGAEYRYWNGVFQPSMFNSLYGRKKVEIVDGITEYLDAGLVGADSMGIFGELYWDILDDDRLSIGGAYHWPWTVSGSTIGLENDDYLKLELNIGSKLIRAYGIHGGFKMERNKVRDTISHPDTYSWMDAYTVITGEVVFPLNPLFSLAIIGGTATRYDENGDVVWANAEETIPKVTPVLNIETRINY
ncbi:MAG: FecR family protein [Spirochaetaceae bacterium]|nr:FecR family protein [Spirochaetaceae bacterium]